MKNKFKNSKAITLIALVITIIVLLILAGVAIATLTGENGLLNRAKMAKEASTNSQIEENVTLADYEDKIDESISGSRETVMVDKDEYERLKNEVKDLKDSTEYKIGDTYDCSFLTTMGFISNTKKILNFSIALDKKVSEEVTKVKLYSYYFDIRSPDGGYLINSASTSTTITPVDIGSYFQLTDVSANYVTFQYIATTAFSYTNNTPISFTIKDLKLTFE